MSMLIMFDLGFLSIAILGALYPLDMWQSFRTIDPAASVIPPIAARPKPA